MTNQPKANGRERVDAGKPKHALIDRESFLACVDALLQNLGQETPTSGAADFEPWITIADGADYAAVSEDTVREWIGRSWLPNARVGRVQRVRRSDIDALFKNEVLSSPASEHELTHPRAAEILAGIKAKRDG